MSRLIEAMITAAALAGRYRQDARNEPDRAGGWLRKADRWSAVAAKLASDLVEAAGCQTQWEPAAPLPDHAARHDRS